MPSPTSIERTHQELLGLMVATQHLQGRTGALAAKLARTLQPHLDREDEYALPLLGLLRTLVGGKLSLAEAKRASRLYARMREEYPRMSREHQELAKLIERLKKVSNEEGHPTATRFAEKLEQHAQQEEELLYPAAFLAGRLASEKPHQRTTSQGRSKNDKNPQRRCMT